MAATANKSRYTIDIQATANGNIRAATVLAIDTKGTIRALDKGDLSKASERRRVGKELARQMGDDDCAKCQRAVENKWNELLDQDRRIREQQAAGSAEAVAVETVGMLDAEAKVIRRPLCLIDGMAYAAAWVNLQRVTSQSVKEGAIVKHDPPLINIERAMLILRSDGAMFADAALPDARPLSSLGLDVRLPSPLSPGRDWSGAGVKRFLAGERRRPADVFRRVAGVIDRFIDFARSLAPQEILCEMTACYVLSTYLLDALNVVGYFWPNGERGTGKTSYLQVVTELAYLGQVILAGSSYPCLRDLADYGATLAFDDAEAVMDTRRTDPDKRTLLLAGSRRGATIAVKELVGDKWETRHINTFCPRLFSAIRSPDEVLGSRSIVVPLVRSGDPRRAKANPMDPADWPTDRRRLIDDLWRWGWLTCQNYRASTGSPPNSPLCPAATSTRARPILAVAAWLTDRHGAEGLFDRMEKLSRDYQQERGDYEAADVTRVLLRALLTVTEGYAPGETVSFRPLDVADKMKAIALAEDLAEPDKPFTTARRVGWLLKRQRFRRGEPDQDGKRWQTTRREIEAACAAYGIVFPRPDTPG